MPTKSVRSVNIEICGHHVCNHANTQLQVMTSESRREMSDWDKGRIEGQRNSMSHDDIEHELHIPHRTISDFLHHLDERDTADNIPYSGRPRTTSASQDQLIIQTAKANTRIPLTELRNITNIEASLSTIRRRLQEDHIRKWRVVDRRALTAVHAEKCLNWALEQQRWREKKWKKVI